MTPRLSSIRISNFRSICGEITVPLDASVVLIHGPNGAGKTSVLSAIELGLTGAMNSLDRGDPTYTKHLVNKSSDQGKIELTVNGLYGQTSTSTSVLTSYGLDAKALLKEFDRRFFSERCYLSQATLGRLLELYQHQASKSDSPLTRFVKDLLGLDRLESLISGLHPTGDVRRLRTAVPTFWAAREEIPKLEAELARLQTEKIDTQSSIESLRASIFVYVKQLHPEIVSLPPSPESALPATDEKEDEEKLQILARARRDLQAARSKWTTLAAGTNAAERTQLESLDTQSRLLLEQWQDTTGASLESLHKELVTIFTGLPSPTIGSPEEFRAQTLHLVNKEEIRISGILDRDVVDDARIAALNQLIEQGKARVSVLDGQLSISAKDTDRLAKSLAEMLTHVNNEICPVCERDFKETSSTVRLADHVASRIAALTDQATRLQDLANDKAKTSAALGTADRELAEILARKQSPESRDSLKTRRARMIELNAKLKEIESESIEGVSRQRRASEASKSLSQFRSRDEQSTQLRSSVDEISKLLKEQPLEDSESLESSLNRLLSAAENHEAAANEKRQARRLAIEHIGQWRTEEARRQDLLPRIAKSEANLEGLKKAKAESDRRVEMAKELGIKAREARTAIVRRVFNDELNQLWRDLFVRLAPEEAFIPAFALPDNTGSAVEAVLETLHRPGGKGGDPRAMLSAGNLNTAALTLFLSLHLAAKPVLPWLIIDDPVQSMDEVHISQFAALLRTLSKQHGRQVIVAVHERTLFEYLALELSPAFQDDRLITIELGKDAAGKSTVIYEPNVYVTDSSFAA